MCIPAMNLEDGAAGVVDPASFGWTVTSAGSGLPTTPLVGRAGLCLNLAADNNTNGTKVHVYTCNGTDGRQWTELADGTIRTAGKCLDAPSSTVGTQVDITTCAGQS